MQSILLNSAEKPTVSRNTDRNGQRKMACRPANARVTPILASVCGILPLRRRWDHRPRAFRASAPCRSKPSA